MTTALAPLPQAADVPSVSANDDAAMAAVAKVLKEFGVDQRFGLTLLHAHEGMGKGEIYVESHDPSNPAGRILRPKLQDQATGKATQWRLDGSQPVVIQRCDDEDCVDV